MYKLRVKNFGPITDGYEDNNGFITFDKYTFFLGDQGSGKSTVAKLISIFSWLEKSFFRGDYDLMFFDSTDFDSICRNQLLSDYFTEKTEIEYIGDAYHFLYKGKIFSGKDISSADVNYLRPKIMYIPSERNILSVVKNVDELNNLPPMLRLLRRRYLQACEHLNENNIFNLPLVGYKAIINSLNGETLVQEEKSGKAVPLICASSGLQSVVPSSVVTEYLANSSMQSVLEKIRELNEKTILQLKSCINNNLAIDELDRFITSGLSKSVSEDSLKKIKQVANRYINNFFLNIVEEPEQNLFPASQMKNLAFLLEAANINEMNTIIITTHSPYVLSYITLAAKAFELSKLNVPEDEIVKIISKSSWIDGNKCAVYQLEDGKIKLLPVYGRGLPSDSNMLNLTLGESNDMFDKLLNLEEDYVG